MKEEYNLTKWVSFAPKFLKTIPEFQITDSFYFDEHPHIIIGLPLLGTFYISLPIKTGKTDNCDWKTWGFDFYANSLVIYLGTKSKYIGFPFFSLEWLSTEILLKDGTWEKETKGNRKEFYLDDWKDKKETHIFDFKYVLKNGNIQERKATVTTERRTWYRKYFKWFPKLNYVRATINIEFSDEVGERTGSWKGGTIGCGYDLKKGETVEQCFRRMETERKFN